MLEIHKHDELLKTLEEHFAGQQLGVVFTQWDGDEEEEEVTELTGQLQEWRLSDNEFGEKDLYMRIEAQGEGDVEILMEIPAEEENLAQFGEGRLSIFGTEAELILTR